MLPLRSPSIDHDRRTGRAPAGPCVWKDPADVCGVCGLECVALNFSYDTAGRTSSLTVDLANAGTSAGHYAGTHGVTYGWDGLGRLVAATDDNGDGTDVSIERVYDSTGAVLSETSTIGGVPLAVASRYDLAGRRDRVTYPGGKVVDLGFDALSRVTTLALDEATIASNAWFGIDRRVETDFPLDGVAWRAWSGGQSSGVRVPSFDAAGRRTDGRVEPRTGTGTRDGSVGAAAKAESVVQSASRARRS